MKSIFKEAGCKNCLDPGIKSAVVTLTFLDQTPPLSQEVAKISVHSPVICVMCWE